LKIHYGEAIIQVRPAVVGFSLELESMMAAADVQRVNQQFLERFLGLFMEPDSCRQRGAAAFQHE